MDGQLTQFRFFDRNRVNCTKEAAGVSLFLSKLDQAIFQARSSNRWLTGPVSFFVAKQGELHDRGRRNFDFFTETGPVGHPLEFEPAKSGNPTRFLSKIDQ